MNTRALPMVDAKGTSRECGRTLGKTWRELLRKVATSKAGRLQWWREPRFSKLVGRYTPHLADLYEGLAEGAKLPSHKLVIPTPADLFRGCTSFAVSGSHTVSGRVICGQTKDTPLSRLKSYQVLRLQPSDAPASLTLTYPGMLFGHGFVKGGCAIFRNSLHAGEQDRGELPYDAWGLLSLHCSRVEEVVEILHQVGVRNPLHCTVCDSHGEIAGIENGQGGVAVLPAKRGIYIHANHVLAGSRMRRHEHITRPGLRSSQLRKQNLEDALAANGKHLTPGLAHAALSNHKSFPRSVCNHESDAFCTSAAIIAELGSGTLWVTAGPPCENWPVEYRLD